MILEGDCLDRMREMEADSVDAVVTDPPYGLSKEPDIAEVLSHWLAGDDYIHGSVRKGKKHCANHILGDAIVSDTRHSDTGVFQEPVPLSVALFPLPVSPHTVQLNNEVSVGEEEISDESAAFMFKDMLMNEGDAGFVETLNDIQLSLRVREGTTPCVGECSCFTELGSSLYCIPVWVTDDTLSEAEASSSVVTGRRAEVPAVLTLDVRGRTAKFAPAESTCEFNTAFELVSPELVRALARASGFAAMLEAGEIGGVDESTNGAITFNLLAHKSLLVRLENPIVSKQGFMGKTWDSFVPGPAVWREVYRVLKPGGHLLCFSGTRTQDLMGISLRLAGFEIRDVVQWIYSQGFPKSLSVDKALDKLAGAEREVVGSKLGQPGYSLNPNPGHGVGMSGNVDGSLRNPEAECAITAPATDEARKWEGFGSALKPAHEPIALCRKPLSESSIARNVLKHGTGAINVDASRVAHGADVDLDAEQRDFNGMGYQGAKDTNGVSTYKPTGRFPANLILSHSPECRRIGEKRTRSGKAQRQNQTVSHFGNAGAPQPDLTYADPDGKETVEDWECTESCPVAEMDRQSGTLHARGNKAPTKRQKSNGVWAAHGATYGVGPDGPIDPGDKGSAARFFMCFEPDTGAGFRYQAKASRAERNAGLEGMEEKTNPSKDYGFKGVNLTRKDGGENRVLPTANSHPTVKSTSLMAYLVKMVTPPGGTVLDPFAGSGSTLVAAVQEGFDCIGIEAEPEYAEIARRRVAHCNEEDSHTLF